MNFGKFLEIPFSQNTFERLLLYVPLTKTAHKMPLNGGTWKLHCVKNVCIQSYSGPYFPAFGLNMDRYGVICRYGEIRRYPKYSRYREIRIHCIYEKIRTRITPNMDTFHAVPRLWIYQLWSRKWVLLHLLLSSSL